MEKLTMMYSELNQALTQKYTKKEGCLEYHIQGMKKVDYTKIVLR